MWMSAPTPLTRTSIVLLKASSVNPIGTRRNPRTSIQRISAACISGLTKTKQLQTKLTKTAITEINALNLRVRPVISAISAAPVSGVSKRTQTITKILQSENQKCEAGELKALILNLKFKATDIFDVGSATGAIERNDNGQTNSYFGSGDGDYEKDQNLRVVVG